MMWSGLLAVSCAMWVINPEHMQQVVEWLRERNSILKKMGVLSDLVPIVQVARHNTWAAIGCRTRAPPCVAQRSFLLIRFSTSVWR